MNPCLNCRRDEDYCHETGQDEHCRAWQDWKTQILVWLGEIKKNEIERAEAQMRKEVITHA